MDPQGNKAEMPWIPVDQNWQTNLLWPMDPPSEFRIGALHTATPNFAHKPTLVMLLTSSGQEWQFHIATDI